MTLGDGAGAWVIRRGGVWLLLALGMDLEDAGTSLKLGQ